MTSDSNPLYGRFDDMVDALLRPVPPPPSATLLVADLYCGNGELGQAVLDAGLEVVYTHEPDSATRYPDFEIIPPFDFLTATMPSTDAGREEALEFALRFLRVRRPATFLLMSEHLNGDGAGFIRLVRNKTRRLGYRVSPARNGHGFVIGVLGVNPFVFPPPDPPDDILEDEEQEARPKLGTTKSRRSGPPALSPGIQSAIEQIMRNLS